MPPPYAHDLADLNKIAFFERNDLRTHRTSKPGPAEHAQNDGEREVILDRDEHGEDEQNGKGRQRHEHVGDHADDLIRPSPCVSRRHAHDDADADGNERRQEGDRHHVAGAVNDHIEQVSAHTVRSEPMFPRRLLIHIGKRCGIVIRKDQPPEQGKENKYEQNDRTRKRLFVGIDHGAERPEALPQADKKCPRRLERFHQFFFHGVTSL